MTVQTTDSPDSARADPPDRAGTETPASVTLGTRSIGLVNLPVGDGRQRSPRRSLALRLAVPMAIFVA